MIRSLPILFFLGIFLLGCHTETIKEPRPVDLILGRIGGTWRTKNITLDGVAQSAYENFTVSFSGNQTDDLIYFTTTGRPEDSDFPESGSLRLGSNIETDLLMQPDGWEISYWIHDSQLQMEFLASQNHQGGGWDPSGWQFWLKR